MIRVTPVRLGLAVFVVLAGACGKKPSPPPAAAAAGEAAYVGRAACAGCHPAETKAWTGSDHDRAMQEATTATVLGSFDDATFTQHGVTSRFFRRGGKYVVNTEGDDGKLADFEVLWTFGVFPLQQYLVKFPDGRVQTLPFCWDSRPKENGGQRWYHIYGKEKIPPHDLLFWTRPAQNWNHMCADCHSTAVRKGYDAVADRYATTFSDVNVSCEACHGPSSRHVAWAAAKAKGAGSPAANGLVVHLKRNDRAAWQFAAGKSIAERTPPAPSAEVDTCAPCHARRGTNHEPRVPGESLLTSHRPAFLTEGLYAADGTMEDEVYDWGSFLQSRMFAKGVVCSDCHEPHSLKLTGPGDVTCVKCHRVDAYAAKEHHHHAAGSKGAQCASCHMPARTYMGIDVRHDHGFKVPRPDLSVAIGTPNACNDCHKGRSTAWAAAAVKRWFPKGKSGSPHWATALDAGRKGLANAETALVEVLRDSTAPAIVRGTAASLLRTLLGPRSLPALEAALADPEPLVRLGAAESLDAVPDLARRVRLAAALAGDEVRAARLSAGRVLSGIPPGASAIPPAVQAAIDEYRASELLNADRPDGRLNLGGMFLARGDLAGAEREYREAIRLEPAFPRAYVNLADLLRQTNREPEGESVLRGALAAHPEDADLHHALGLLLVRTGRRAEALGELKRASALRPRDARYAYVFAVGLWDAGRKKEALDLLERTRRAHPADRDVLEALTTLRGR
jgi:tetratricopeptide (TPR) repeat protein